MWKSDTVSFLVVRKASILDAASTKRQRRMLASYGTLLTTRPKLGVLAYLLVILGFRFAHFSTQHERRDDQHQREQASQCGQRQRHGEPLRGEVHLQHTAHGHPKIHARYQT